MVGRTPEYLGKQIQAREVKLATIGRCCAPTGASSRARDQHPRRAAVDVHGSHRGWPSRLRLPEPGPEQRLGLRRYTRLLQPVPGNVGAHGITYADLAGGRVMMLGRFVPILAVLALAGSLAPGASLPRRWHARTDTPSFVIFLIGFVAIFAVLDLHLRAARRTAGPGHDGPAVLAPTAAAPQGSAAIRSSHRERRPAPSGSQRRRARRRRPARRRRRLRRGPASPRDPAQLPRRRPSSATCSRPSGRSYASTSSPPTTTSGRSRATSAAGSTPPPSAQINTFGFGTDDDMEAVARTYLIVKHSPFPVAPPPARRRAATPTTPLPAASARRRARPAPRLSARRRW